MSTLHAGVHNQDRTQDSVLDRETSLARVGGDLDLLRELAGLFLREAPIMMDQLREASNQSNASEVERQAHGLKGAAANFGATAAVDAARELEFLCRDRKLDQIQPSLANLEAALLTLQDELAAL